MISMCWFFKVTMCCVLRRSRDAGARWPGSAARAQSPDGLHNPWEQQLCATARDGRVAASVPPDVERVAAWRGGAALMSPPRSTKACRHRRCVGTIGCGDHRAKRRLAVRAFLCVQFVLLSKGIKKGEAFDTVIFKRRFPYKGKATNRHSKRQIQPKRLRFSDGRNNEMHQPSG